MQKEQGILSSYNDYGAGYFGNQTKKMLNKLLAEKTIEKQEEKQVVQSEIENTKILITVGLGKGAEGEDVNKLQELLKQLGYYQGEINGIYDNSTIEAVFKFQKEYNVVNTPNQYGAGFFGNKTKQALEVALDQQKPTVTFGKVLAKMDFKIITMKANLPNRLIAQAESKTMIFEVKSEQKLITMTLKMGDK